MPELPSTHSSASMPLHEFQLFVAGNTAVALRAIQNSHVLLEKYLKNNYHIDVIDVFQKPEKMIEANILTTPVLIRKKPFPELTIIGDLSDMEKAAHELFLG